MMIDRISRICLLLAAAVVAGLAINPAVAQDISTYYTVMHPDEFTIDWKSFYLKAEQLTLDTREKLPHKLDIPYGMDPKQRLDVYLPEEDPEAAPVFIFLHGGGSREGDRLQYGYVAAPFAKHGIVTVVASYRLQPEFASPEQREDAQAAVAWVYRNIKSLGGDPEQIYVGGHSAGSRLTAILSYSGGWREASALPADVIKGSALISGVSANVVSEIVHPPPHNVIAVGALEAEGGSDNMRLKNSEEMASKLRSRGQEVDFLVPEGLDHATLVMSLGAEDSELFQSILRMIKS